MSLTGRIHREKEETDKAQDVLSRISYIASSVQPLDNSRFIKFGESTWVYREALATHRKLDYYATEKNIVTHLSFPEQICLQKRIEDRFGIKTRFGSSEENFRASYSKETKDYRNNVLKPFYVYTGELIIKQSEEVLRKVLRIGFSDKNSSDTLDHNLINADGKEVAIEQNTENMKALIEQSNKNKMFQTNYFVGPVIRRELPTRKGCFDSFEVFPTDKDLKDKGKGRLAEKWFSGGLSAVQNYWVSDNNIFGIKSTSPLATFNCVIPIWTDENPKK